MSFEGCFIDIERKTGKTLSKEDKDNIQKEIQRIVDKHKEGGSGNLEADVRADIAELTNNMQIAANIEKRNRVLNLDKKIRLKTYLRNTWDDVPGEGVKAFLGGSTTNRAGARNSVATSINAAVDSTQGALFSDLSKIGLLNEAFDGKLDYEIARARYQLSQPELDEKAFMDIPEDAREIAKVLEKHQEAVRVRANNAGSWINKLPGRFVKRTHDHLKLKKAAGSEYGAGHVKHKEKWVSDVSKDLDFEQTFPDLSRDQGVKALESLYDQLSNGQHLSGQGATNNSQGFKGFKNFGKSMSHERVLKFKDFEGEWRYYQKYSGDGSLVEHVVGEFSNMARDTAIMERLGPNAQSNFDEVIEDIANDYIRSNQAKKAGEIREQKKWVNDNLWPVLDGSINRADGDKALKYAEIHANIRGVFGTGDLAKAILSQPSDIVFGAGMYRYTGERSMASYLAGMKEQSMGIIKRIGKKIGEDEREIASELGIFLDSMKPATGRFSADPNEVGKLSKSLQKLYKMTGLGHWQDRSRLAATISASHRFARKSNLTFDELPKGMQEYFNQFEIGKAEWDLFRSGKKRVVDGRELLTNTAIDSLPDEKIAGLIGDQLKKSKSAKHKARMIANKRAELKNKFTNLFNDYAYNAATEPTQMDRAIMLGSTKPGTWKGEAWRYFWQYKSFMVSVMRKHMGRELHGYSAEAMSTPRAIAAMMKGKNLGGMGGMANMVAMGIPMGYLSMTMKDLAAGREPRVPENTEQTMKILSASLAQSGSLGIYGDFLFGEAVNRHGQSLAATIGGPGLGRVEDLYKVYTKIRQGKNPGPAAFYFTLNNAPGINTAKNLFFTHAAFNYLIMYRMQEFMNPGYLKRMERRMKKEKNQEFIVPPSKVIPRGGF